MNEQAEDTLRLAAIDGILSLVKFYQEEIKSLTWHLEHAMKHVTECDCDAKSNA